MLHKTKTVMVEFSYEYQHQPYVTHKAWPCSDKTDGEAIVKYYAMKTGALGYKFIVEDQSYEEIIKEAASKTSEIAEEKDPAQSITQG